MARSFPLRKSLLSLVFVSVALGMGGFTLSEIGRRHWRTQPTFALKARFAAVGGLEAGHRVRVQGIDAGVVRRIVAPGQPGAAVEVVMDVDQALRNLVRVDAVARIVSEGLVGARVVEITPGRPDAPALGGNPVIAAESIVAPSDLLNQAGRSLARIDEAATAARKALDQLATVAQAVNRGEGTLGKLIHDQELYNRLNQAAKDGDRALVDLDDNLQALKETWPVSRYFHRRAYLDRERLLYRPGAERSSRSLPAEDLFETGRAVLTPTGRARLDQVASWFKTVARRSSELVVASFTEGDPDPDRAEILTQEQADSVRDYLVTRHGVGSLGWFKSRKVAAVGFGAQAPQVADSSSFEQPPRRVEIIVFTPAREVR